jgi:general secretion pathway protein B
MSFILDALRKSEHDRQRDAAPGLADAPIRRPTKSRNLWVPAVVGLIAVNGALLLYLWLRTPAPPQSAPEPTPAPAISQQPLAKPAPEPGTRVATVPQERQTPTGPVVVRVQPQVSRDLAAEMVGSGAAIDGMTQASPSPAKASDTTPTAPQTTPAPQATRAAPAVAPTPAQTSIPTRTEAAPDNGSDYMVLPTLETMQLSGIVKLPPIRIDIHVYSPDPAKCFVYINMKKYRQGATLDDGPFLEEITSEGVILTHLGSRFTVPKT